ncbi:uncharacterized protein B4U80_01830, partial [Leptotrombidium deliense]
MGREWIRHFFSGNPFTVIKEIREQEKLKLKEILEKHKELFDGDVGVIKESDVKVTLKSDATPIFLKARPVAYALIPKIDKELDSLIKKDILYKVSHSDWATPIVPVLKENGDVRICADFKVTLNQRSEIVQHPLPSFNEVLYKLKNGKYFSKIDVKQAFHQLNVSEESRKYFTINTHRGLFRYKRLPFGFHGAPALWQESIEKILAGIDKVVAFMDDIIIPGETEDENLRLTEEVLQRFEDFGIKVNKEKCEFLKTEMKCLGHVFTSNGVKMDPTKIKALLEAPAPENVEQTKSWCGFVNYYRDFIPDLGNIMYPITRLLRKDFSFKWCFNCEQAFRKIKEIIASDIVLAPFNPSRKTIISCDASSYGYGAVFSQIDDKGIRRPVAFCSRVQSDTERKRSQFQKEAGVIIYAIQYWHKLLWGFHFTIETDHKPLTGFFNPSKQMADTASMLMLRWQAIL